MNNATLDLTIITLNPYEDGKDLKDFAREVIASAKKLKATNEVITFRHRSEVDGRDEQGNVILSGSWLFEVLRAYLPANKYSVIFKTNRNGSVYLHTDYIVKLAKKAVSQNLGNPAEFKL